MVSSPARHVHPVYPSAALPFCGRCHKNARKRCLGGLGGCELYGGRPTAVLSMPSTKRHLPCEPCSTYDCHMARAHPLSEAARAWTVQSHVTCHLKNLALFP